MKITWLGHSSFRIEIQDQILLVDPWFTGNPVFPQDLRDQAIKGASAILVTHAHGDHTGDALAISADLGIPIAGIYDLMNFWQTTAQANTIGFNKGGTIKFGDVRVTMVNAVHSSTLAGDNGPMAAGSEAGFMISGEGHTVYISGDTDIMADMEWMGDLHNPDVGILSAGGHFTMDMARAAYAAKKYFNFKTLIPCHYRTFPLLEQSAQILIDALPGVDVQTPEVMQTIEI